MNSGQPLAANPGYEVFYPLQWLLPIGSFRDAFHFVVVLHYPLAAIGMFLLLRSLGARRLVACFGGFSYALGGTMLSMGSLIPFLYSMAWLPWIAWLFRRAVQRGTISGIAPAGLALGLMLLIGDVSMILQSGALVAAYALFAARKQRSMRPIALAAATIILGTLIGAVQIFPALDHQRDSGRSRPLTFAVANTWSMPPYRPIEIVWPTLFGSASPDVAFQWGLIDLYPREAWPWVMNLYPGIKTADCQQIPDDGDRRPAVASLSREIHSLDDVRPGGLRRCRRRRSDSRRKGAQDHGRRRGDRHRHHDDSSPC